MDTKQCPRCGHGMEYNPIVMDYVCDHCQYLSIDAMEKMADEYERGFSILNAIEKHKDWQGLKHMMDREEG